MNDRPRREEWVMETYFDRKVTQGIFEGEELEYAIRRRRSDLR